MNVNIRIISVQIFVKIQLGLIVVLVEKVLSCIQIGNIVSVGGYKIIRLTIFIYMYTSLN